MSGGGSSALDMVNALSVAWATFSLYDEPVEMEAFVRAVETLGAAPTYPWRVQVASDGFLIDGQDVGGHRDAARRLARQVFAHEGAALELLNPPSATELLSLFHVVAAEPGSDAMLELWGAGVRSISLLRRELLLAEAAASDGEASVTAWSTGYDGDAEPFATGLLEETGDDPVATALRFVEEYERVFDLVGADDHWGLEEVVHTFVDSAGFLPRRHQAAVVDRLLSRQDRRACLMFLDQMGAEELGELGRHLAPLTHPLLLDYARIAAGQGERRHAELLALVEQTQAARPVQHAVLEAVDAALEPVVPAASAPPIERLRQTMSLLTTMPNVGFRVVRGMLAAAAGTEGFERAARLWAKKATQAIRVGDVSAAAEWLDAARSLGVDHAESTALRLALRDHVDVGVVDRLIEVFDSPEEASSTVRAAARFVLVDGIIDRFSDTEDPNQVAFYANALIRLANHLPDSLTPYLKEDRWRIVVIVVRALGASQHPTAADRIRSVSNHEHHRVRLEALKALGRSPSGIEDTEIVDALTDSHPDVRSAGAEAARSSERSTIDATLIERLNGAPSLEIQRSLLAALGLRSTIEARTFVERVARRRFVVRSIPRTLRRDARALLATHRGVRHD